MIIYSVTVKVETTIHQEWLEWMKTKHIPDVLDTGLFLECRICRILGEEPDGGETFNMQYLCKDMEALNEYQQKFAKALQEEHTSRYKDRYVAFRTLLGVEGTIEKRLV